MYFILFYFIFLISSKERQRIPKASPTKLHLLNHSKKKKKNLPDYHFVFALSSTIFNFLFVCFWTLEKKPCYNFKDLSFCKFQLT